MRTFNTNEMTQQFDNLFMAPGRTFLRPWYPQLVDVS